MREYWRQLHYENIHSLFRSPVFLMAIKSRRMDDMGEACSRRWWD